MLPDLKLPHNKVVWCHGGREEFRPVMKSLCRDLSDEQVGAGPGWSPGKAPEGY
jgi:hypothetical protein